ncbi:unnamed protein product [Sphenostylis stenocarpa]|uniref:Uncharacterized protein n=1 Tax=Sphenostylis stenocarpa TaxID=92480 RepID=A0AA86VZY7_9FABA|nr:unnamed protein product [Sphenostylis stenocarpa]
MIHSCVSDAKTIDSALHSLEHLPLSQRRKLLHSPTLRNDTHTSLASAPSFQFDAVVKKGDGDFDSKVAETVAGYHKWKMKRHAVYVACVWWDWSVGFGVGFDDCKPCWKGGALGREMVPGAVKLCNGGEGGLENCSKGARFGQPCLEGSELFSDGIKLVLVFHGREVTCPMFEIDDSRIENTSGNVTILARCPTLPAFGGCATIKVEDYQIPSSSVDKGREASIQLDFPTPKVKKEIPEDMVYDLDHIVLKERLRMLLVGYFVTY